jgi:hypothetical protein
VPNNAASNPISKFYYAQTLACNVNRNLTEWQNQPAPHR